MEYRFEGILAEIAEAAGPAAALKLAETYGGVRVTFPAILPPQHWLVKCVGPDAAHAICQHFRVGSPEGRMAGFHNAHIPLGPFSGRNAARRIVLAKLQAGGSAREAALAASVHERTVWRIRAQAKHMGLL